MIGFRKKAEHPGAIALESGDVLGPESAEVARVWINDEAGASVWIAAYKLENPKMFGYLMSDVVRHAAKAYASTWSLEEDVALQAIVDGLGEELCQQFGSINTIQEGSLN
ncbi:MAG: DUF5076 domain-containing protein [Sphingobium yanoikuyae]